MIYERYIWFSQFWWLALGQSDQQGTRAADVIQTATIWPPFWGERVPLGGDGA